MLPDAGCLRAVLFDAVGTVIHAHPSVVQVYQEHGNRCGSQLDAKTIAARLKAALLATQGETAATSETYERKRWRRVVCSIFDDVPDAGEGLFRSLWDHFAEPAHWRVFDDVHSAWSYLESRGVVIGIASNFDARIFPLCERLMPLCRSQHVFCSSQIGYAKPSPHFFARVQKTLALPPERILLVGDDAVNDLRGAREAGWQALLIDRGGSAGDHALASLEALCWLLA